MESYGRSSNELFLQFVARISLEMPNSVLAMFSTMKYINAPNFAKFRQIWHAQYLGGFVVHNKAFEGLTGKFPIGFLVWKTNQFKTNPISEVVVDVLDKSVKPVGEKSFYNLPSDQFLSSWIVRPKANKKEVIPLKIPYHHRLL